MKNVPIRFKQCIHAVDVNENYSVVTCNREIPSNANTLNKTHLSTIIFDELTSTYYDNNNEGLVFLFR